MAMETRESRERRARKKMPRHAWEQRAYHVLLHPSPEQEQALWRICHGCWFLRALLVNERNDNRKDNREQKLNGVVKPHYLNRADQYKTIPGFVAQYPDQLGGIHSQVLQNVAVRIDEGTKRWLEAGPGEQVRPPHHKRRRKYRSFTFPQYGSAVNLHHGELYAYASGIGKIPADCWRKLRGLPKTVTIKFKNGKWWAIITCAIQAKDLYKPMQAVAHLPDGSGDPGLETLLTDIERTQYDPPRAWHDYRDQLAHEIRSMLRKFRAREEQWKEDNIDWIAQGVKPAESLRKYPYSQRLQEQIRRVAKLYTKVSNIREYYHRKLAVIIDASFRLFGIEEHGLKFMIRNRRQAKSASDRAIGKMKKAVKSKIGLRYVESAVWLQLRRDRNRRRRGNVNLVWILRTTECGCDSYQTRQNPETVRRRKPQHPGKGRSGIAAAEPIPAVRRNPSSAASPPDEAHPLLGDGENVTHSLQVTALCQPVGK